MGRGAESHEQNSEIIFHDLTSSEILPLAQRGSIACGSYRPNSHHNRNPSHVSLLESQNGLDNGPCYL